MCLFAVHLACHMYVALHLHLSTSVLRYLLISEHHLIAMLIKETGKICIFGGMSCQNKNISSLHYESCELYACVHCTPNP